MSAGYWFYSFDQGHFDRYFGGGAPEAQQAVTDAALWEEDGYFDGSDEMRPGAHRDEILATPRGRRVAGLAERITRHGLSCDGLDAAEARELDRMIASWHAPECLAEQLDFRPHSPDFASRRLMDWIAAPVERSGGRPWWRLGRAKTIAPAAPDLLRQLIDGRRYGSTGLSGTRPTEHYFIAEPREVAALVGEVAAALADAKLRPEDAKLVETYLLAPVEAVAASGRPLFVTYS